MRRLLTALLNGFSFESFESIKEKRSLIFRLCWSRRDLNGERSAVAFDGTDRDGD
jgi:hypothetical protein